MRRHWTLILVLLLTSIAGAQPPATTQSTTEEIPPDVLRTMYQLELGKLYQRASFDELRDAHRLIEEYFRATTAADRRELTSRIESTGIDASILGRITRIRLHWQQLRPGAYYFNERVGPHQVRYFLGIPEGYDRSRPWPMVIMLPGAEAFLGDPRPTGDQVAEIYAGWIRDELSKHPDAIVLMPLLNLNELYGPSQTGMNSVMQPMHHAFNHVNVDPAKVYLFGHSMGGHAAWNLALHYPTYFAAIGVLSGSASQDFQRLRIINLRNTLPVVWHDSEDDVIKVTRARSIVNALRTQKIDVDYEETKGIGHRPSNDIVERVYTKMRTRVRDLYPEEILMQSNRLDTAFNRIDWLQVYQPLNAGEEQRLLLQHGSGPLIVAQNTWRVSTKRAKNRIEALAGNVQTMRFYFNDQMADFDRSISISVNRKVRFEGFLKPSVDEMLKDQLFIGRGWRYYTAVVDVDLAPPRPPATRPSPAN